MPNGLTSVAATFVVSGPLNSNYADPDIVFIAGEGGASDRFAIAYEGQTGEAQRLSVFLREVGLDGSLLTDETVLRDNFLPQIDPQLVALTSGNVVLTWGDTDFAPDSDSVLGMIAPPDDVTDTFNLSADPITLFAGFTRVDEIAETIALSNGGFAVIGEFGQTSSDASAHIGLFTATGARVGRPAELDPGVDRTDTASLAELPDGRIIGLYESDAGFPADAVIKRSIVNGSGALSEAAAEVNYGLETVLNPLLTQLADGRILETYPGFFIDTSGAVFDVRARILTGTGAVELDLGSLASNTANDHGLPSIAATPDGGFLAAWTTAPRGQLFDSGTLVLRRFDADGTPLGAEITVDDADGYDAAIEVTQDGRVLISWSSDPTDTEDNFELKAAVYQLDDLGTPGETRSGTTGQDRLIGTSGDDTLTAGDGADVLDGGAGRDIMSGGLGNDFYFVDNILDEVTGEIAFSAGGGIDTVRSFVNYSQPDNIELVRLGFIEDTDPLHAVGNDAPGTLVGNAGDNLLVGRGGNDQLNGNNGDDRIVGNTGRDTVVGGNGNDTFVYTAYADSRAGAENRDVVNGFGRTAGQDDLIDLSALDANTRTFGVDDAFTFIGGAAFSGQAGQLRTQSLGGPNAVIIEADHNGDRVADLQIFVNLTTFMTGSDFIL